MEVNKEQGEFTYIIYKNNSLQELILFFPVIKWNSIFLPWNIPTALQFFIPGEGRGSCCFALSDNSYFFFYSVLMTEWTLAQRETLHNQLTGYFPDWSLILAANFDEAAMKTDIFRQK